ncbi:uncharacterized protein KY384_003436 [Bacidia gigantensis]|uniref:uncharacterized protein n=1 Tax=Bacidia gigantensis TaxID=2732470 RepID=UPI001D039F1A|nr:uncharacterized protein KY384_003436 [Bacidia gigantensis]KAG8531800.1 hypothetical protein KY384_003436 [Bacidia gigantensis]
MKLLDSVCETLTRALGLSSLSPWGHDANNQQAVGPIIHNVGPGAGAKSSKAGHTNTNYYEPRLPGMEGYKLENKVLDKVEAKATTQQIVDQTRLNVGRPPPEVLPPGPIFAPPNSNMDFICDYSAMRGWKHTAGPGKRNQWLEKPISESSPEGGVFDIFTDYDRFAPIGVTRKYHLNVTDQNINTDGVNRPDGGKVFNGQYPGPLLEGCWGDTMEITVENHLKYNGTTVHWHGVRLLNAFEHDGVNAITQCPIAPGDSYTYKFKITQYGTSWYHSHYSLQYADGLAGPLTFYGPSAGDYDVALDPYLFGDWSHNSAFEDYAVELHDPPAHMTTVILNGRGFYNCENNANPDCSNNTLKVDAPPIYEQVFERGRRYLMRLINTSTASTFIFSIDKHILKIITSDFVAIEPYYADSILVGIGQRYNVIVEANPSNDLIPDEDQNYWIRITGADGCFDIEEEQKNEKLGIIRYNEGSRKTPTTKAFEFSKVCRDEPLSSLVPVVSMEVTAREHPANSIDPDTGDNFEVGVEVGNANYTVPHGNFSRWDILDTPMWLNFSDPTIDHIGDKNWNPAEYALITEDYERDSWVYIVMTVAGTDAQKKAGKRVFVPVAHPMHLHGHDYIILAQEDRAFHPDDVKNGTFKYDNPTRRDVALLPRNGYLAVAFRTDNPGLWIMHCHIAWHASSGLALQVRENEHLINLDEETVKEKDRVCNNWRKWEADSKNWFNPHEFQEDSGI